MSSDLKVDTRVRELIKLIHKNNFHYYCDNVSEDRGNFCSDEQYDELVEELKTLESIYPDFKFEDDEMGITYFWEHLGIINQPKCLKRWEQKLEWYRKQGILPYEEGGGSYGTLIVTRDDSRGEIRANEIERMLAEVLG